LLEEQELPGWGLLIFTITVVPVIAFLNFKVMQSIDDSPSHISILKLYEQVP